MWTVYSTLHTSLSITDKDAAKVKKKKSQKPIYNWWKKESTNSNIYKQFNDGSTENIYATL